MNKELRILNQFCLLHSTNKFKAILGTQVGSGLPQLTVALDIKITSEVENNFYEYLGQSYCRFYKVHIRSLYWYECLFESIQLIKLHNNRTEMIWLTGFR
jgi:hypothetical protein